MDRIKGLLTWAFLLCMASSALAVDLNESFDGTTFPPVGWQSFETGDGVTLWSRTTSNTHSGTAKAQVTDEDVIGVAERWLISPKLHVNDVTDELSYWLRTQFSFVVDNDSIYVRLSATDSLPSSFTTVLAQYKCGSGGAFINEYINYIVSLAPYVGQDIYVAFVHRDEGDGGNQVFLDDVTGPELLAPPNEAGSPSPANEAVGVAANTDLLWVNGIGTETVDLYLAWTSDSVVNEIAAARKINNVNTSSYNPPADLANDQTYYWKVVTRNVYGETDGPVWSFTVVGAPLSGTYDIGGATPDYASFTEAVAALYGNGVAGPVTFDVYGSDYEERIEFIGAIPGANATNRVTFNDASGTARILDSSATTSSIPVVLLNGASYITWDGIDIWASVETDNCLQLQGGSAENIFRDCVLESHLASTVSHAIRLFGNGNSNNLFSGLDCRKGIECIYLTSGAAPASSGIIIENCTTVNCEIALYTDDCDGLIVRDCDFQANDSGSSNYAIETASSAAGTTIHIYRNKIHNVVGTGTIGFLRANMGANTTINFHNNFLYDAFTSGTGGLQGVYASNGTVNYYFNSMYIADLNGTGAVRGYYKAASAQTANIQNNIFYFAEATAATDVYYGLSAGYNPTILENNAYYNDGGTNYQVFDVGTVEYNNLAALQAGTDYENFGVEGNPGFVSGADLHIQPAFTLVSNAGAPIAGITDDIDGDTRTATPDIGADEYQAMAPPNDYAVLELIGITPLYPENTVTPINARVQNRGSAAQVNIPIRLFYANTQVQELLVSLAPEEVDTIVFSWTTPAAPSSGNLEVQSFLPGDVDSANDSAFAAVQVVGLPMSGGYDVGGGDNDYATVAAAVADLALRGVSGAVTFNVYANTYNQSVSVPAIPGASATNTITFVGLDPALTPPEIVAASPTVQLNGADYVTFENIDITCTGTGRAVEITGDADYNTIKDCAITGASVSGTSNYGVYVVGGGNDNNVIENAVISGAYYGVRLSGSSTTSDQSNEVRGCSILEGKYGAYLERQNGSSVHHCDIQPGWASAATEIYGVYVTTHNTGNTTYSYNNQIHNFRSSTTSNGVNVSTSAGTTHISYNNFIYDWNVTGGTVYGMRSTTGNSEFYNNSVRINNVATTGNIYGFYMTGASTAASLVNNILQLDVPTEECWSIYLAGGSLSSNYNCVYGSGTGYNVGFSGSSHATLAAWNAATGFDANSVSGLAGFVDATNLHIAPTFDLVDGAGQTVAIVTTDIDDETRNSPPDIGADEYEFSSLAHDYGVYAIVNLQASYIGGVPTSIQADIENFGTSAETDVPVRLFYNGVQQSELLVSLASGVRDTISLPWTPPTSDFEIGQLEVQAFLATDAYADNDSATSAVTVVGPPMSGIYDLGGGNNDFATFNEAVTALQQRGIDGEVIIEAYDGTYNESIVLTAISGANFVDRVIFRAHQSPELDVVILQDGVAPRVVYFDGADFITFEGIDIVATNATNVAVELDNGAQYITLRDLSITARDSSNSSTRGVKVNFDGNDNCLVDGVTIRGAFYGVRCEGGTGTVLGLEVMNCTILAASYGVYLDDAHLANVHHNDIEPHGYSSTSCYGVYVAALTADDSVFVHANRIHNFRHTNTGNFPDVAGVYSGPGTTGYSYVFNNFVYDFQTSGPGIFGIRSSTGNTFAVNNSILMNNVANGDEIAGIYLGAGSVTALNNIVKVEQDTNTCYAIWRSSGTLVESNYNCLYGTGAFYSTGRDGANIFADFATWQASGRDANGIGLDPGFVSNTDLHIDTLSSTVDGLAQPIALLTEDIDGDPRSATNPDIGADEYEPFAEAQPVVDLIITIDYDNGNAILTWTGTTNAQSYEIFASNVSDFEIIPANSLGSTADTTFVDIGALAASNIRFYVVVASTEPVE